MHAATCFIRRKRPSGHMSEAPRSFRSLTHVPEGPACARETTRRPAMPCFVTRHALPLFRLEILIQAGKQPPAFQTKTSVHSPVQHLFMRHDQKRTAFRSREIHKLIGDKLCIAAVEGRNSTALAMATRCCSPREKTPVGTSVRRMPSLRSRSRARICSSAGMEKWRNVAGRSTFSRAERWGKS